MTINSSPADNGSKTDDAPQLPVNNMHPICDFKVLEPDDAASSLISSSASDQKQVFLSKLESFKLIFSVTVFESSRLTFLGKLSDSVSLKERVNESTSVRKFSFLSPTRSSPTKLGLQLAILLETFENV